MIEGSRVRVSIVGVVVLALFCALFTRLWYLQVAGGTTLAAAANTNRVRTVPTLAPRGRILDAKGRVLVDNRVANVVTVDRKLDAKTRARVVSALSPLLGVDVATIHQRLDDRRVSPYAPVPVGVDVPVDTLAYIGEHTADFPGVSAEPQAVRRYKYGSLGAHVLGYVGEINSDELKAQPTGSYELGDEIGKAGAEQSLESELRGKPGREKLEIDVRGKVIRSLGATKPVPGHDVQLTLDLDAQKVAEESLAQGIAAARSTHDTAVKESYQNFNAPAGSVVVLDARTGAIVAMASNPSYDPNQFANGIPTDVYRQLNDPANHYPLVNRAIQGQYAPGSTFKLVTALAGLSSGAIEPGTTIDDKGSLKVADREFFNAGNARYGSVNLPRALTVSSDVYFYTIGSDLWQRFHRGDPSGNAIQNEAGAFGFGKATGVPLAGEAKGRIPDAAWKKAVHAERPDAFPYADWEPGDNVNTAVGQGDVLVTPLQLASAYATFANGGSLFRPRLASQISDLAGNKIRDLPPTPAGNVPFPDGARAAIVDGLRGAVRDPKGTATGAFSGFPLEQVDVAGKTGTAQVNGKQDTSVFVAVTPPEAAPGQPQYVVLAVVEEGGFGAQTSAPIVRRVIEGLNNLPLTPIQIATASVAN